MTDNITDETTDQADDALEQPEQPQDEATQPEELTTDTDAQDDDQEATGPAREAAKYRRRLRDAEADLEAARAGQETAQRALVDHLAQTTGRIKPEALWAAGTTLEDLLTDGAVDAQKVADAADSAAHQLGLTRRPKPDPAQGRNSAGPRGDDMAAIIAGR